MSNADSYNALAARLKSDLAIARERVERALADLEAVLARARAASELVDAATAECRRIEHEISVLHAAAAGDEQVMADYTVVSWTRPETRTSSPTGFVGFRASRTSIRIGCATHSPPAG